MLPFSLSSVGGSNRNAMLGDAVESALTKVGITKELVERWIGKCCCDERKMRLNALDAWTRRVISGRMESAAEHLKSLMTEE